MDPTPLGDYFADDEYVRTDVAAGITRDRAGTRLLGLADDFLTVLHQTLDAECGPAAERIMQDAGRAWGRDLAKRWTAELAEYRGEPLAETSVARFQTDLQSAFRQLGWGVLTLDFSRFDKGLLVAELRHAPQGQPADALLAGTLAGLLSHVAGRDLAAAATPPVGGTPGEAGSLRRFVIALPERLEKVSDALHRRRPHGEILTELDRVRV
jgi:predicted hydrocarbon binding protein